MPKTRLFDWSDVLPLLLVLIAIATPFLILWVVIHFIVKFW